MTTKILDSFRDLLKIVVTVEVTKPKAEGSYAAKNLHWKLETSYGSHVLYIKVSI